MYKEVMMSGEMGKSDGVVKKIYVKGNNMIDGGLLLIKAD